jgi:hypothetical protein
MLDAMPGVLFEHMASIECTYQRVYGKKLGNCGSADMSSGGLTLLNGIARRRRLLERRPEPDAMMARKPRASRARRSSPKLAAQARRRLYRFAHSDGPMDGTGRPQRDHVLDAHHVTTPERSGYSAAPSPY